MIPSARLWLWVVAVLAIRFLVAAVLPVTTDEAYYAIWSTNLSWGYFDHPPMVALGGLLRDLAGPEFSANPLIMRLPVVLLASLIIPASLHAVARRLGARQPTLAVFIFCASFAGIASGVLLTPDAFLMVFWTASLLAAILVIDGLMKPLERLPVLNAITCGIFFGLGMLAKYTFALMPLIFTWMLLFNRSLRTVPLTRRASAFALTTVTAVLVFSPHVIWNARHQWATFGFQLRHGFAGDHGAAPLEDGFEPPPAPSRLPYSRLDDRLAGFFSQYDAVLSKRSAVVKPAPPRRTKGKLEQGAKWFWEYLGSQLAAPGLLLPAAAIMIFRERRTRRPVARSEKPDPALALTRLAAWVPFAFFGLFAPFTKVEANWPAMGFAGVAILAALHPAWSLGEERKPRLEHSLLPAGIGNALILLAIATLAIQPQLRAAISSKPDRISEETSGFSSIANFVAGRWNQRNTPLFVDKYQWTAMIKLHRPDASVQQIRGITRDAEFTRAGKWQSVDASTFRKLPGISLLTSEDRPPRFEAFAPAGVEMLCVKPDGSLGNTLEVGSDPLASCHRTLFLYDYRPW
ncbi:MAG: hypothetical protein RIQ81_518 [Pseudomonadota bacterium]|jgi:4-amino-4-deoxy-L-arabinose transferase-like glycosyltransferase